MQRRLRFVPDLSACTDKSRSWYQEAAEAGDPDALYNYAKDIDRMGNDPRRAQELMRSAAEQGLPMAQNDLAAMLMAGRGCRMVCPIYLLQRSGLANALSRAFIEACMA